MVSFIDIEIREIIMFPLFLNFLLTKILNASIRYEQKTQMFQIV